jgi:NAD(P)-dependent dehydrogenase (short-subunit alcohol dehydrogenase family)
MLMRNLSFDLAPRGIITAAFCPGWIKTRMGGPTAPLEAPPSIAGIRRIIAGLTPDTSGRFWLWTGELNPY